MIGMIDRDQRVDAGRFGRQAGSVAGQTSTHLPHRVQASIMASTRPCSADSKLVMMSIS
jgi:hypothetical protein